MKYLRSSLEVDVVKYEIDKGLEDGFELWTKIVTNGWISANNIIKITRKDGTVVCPFIRNRRGIIFIREGDYIISESDGERHVCGEDKFNRRYKVIE